MSHTVLTTIDAPEKAAGNPNAGSALRLQCVVCSQPLTAGKAVLPSRTTCPRCGFVLAQAHGIFRCLAPNRGAYFEQFVRDYELVRTKEGRGSTSPDYYLNLPFKDLTRRNVWQWSVRAKTWRHLEKHVLPQLERAYPTGCDVLDLGAGNGWASFRLSLRGHRPIAVDLLDNDADGLGAARHYLDHLPSPFPRFQAEIERLPFAPDQFDVAIFNASFHYSVDYELTLRETLRCLRRPGHVLILDSPFYRRDESGQAMLEEKHAAFQRQYGFRSDSIPSREYLTKSVLDNLAVKFSLQWKSLRPWYGWNWALRPVKARLSRRREPSKFFLIWSEVKK